MDLNKKQKKRNNFEQIKQIQRTKIRTKTSVKQVNMCNAAESIFEKLKL